MILSIESSCDESALAVFKPGAGILGEWVHSQIKEHQVFGGVVPGLAAREHYKNFPVLLESALAKVPVIATDLEAIAVTQGPGLAGCLALGIALAKSLALAWKKPLWGVNHLRGHAFSPFIDLYQANPNSFHPLFSDLLPHLGLIVSGGNTLLFELQDEGKIDILAQTVDDAAGEALDKGAKLLGMSYPGGPHIEKQALKGNPKAFRFPRAFPSADDMRFSFSGLKTSLRYLLQEMSPSAIQETLNDMCASYQEAVVDQLLNKVKQALENGDYKSMGLSGGVSNNQHLQSRFAALAKRYHIQAYYPQPKHTGDNGAMIAFAAYLDRKHCCLDTNFNLPLKPSLALIG